MHVISEIAQYDNKRNKVTLDEGGLTFLLYKGECRKLGLTGKEGSELSEKEYAEIMDMLLLRAKKRALFYLKNEDKTEYKIKAKLRQGYYPEEIIEKVIEYLREHKYSDDERYAESFVEEKRGKNSKREIEEKLYQKGVAHEMIRNALECLSDDDEMTAAKLAIRKTSSKDPYVFLIRKGFSMDIINRLRRLNGDTEEYQ